MKIESKLPYVICEIANVHGGEVDYVNQIIDEFSKIKYKNKGIKFQIFSPDGISLEDFDWYSVYKELYFDEPSWKKLIEKSAKIGDVWIDIFDCYGADIVKKNLSHIYGIKLQASVLKNYEIREILKSIEFRDRRLIINVSGMTLDEIRTVYDHFSETAKNLILQIGYQEYPTKINNTGLQKIRILQAAFPGVPLCMADHADADKDFSLQAPIYAYMVGCEYIEKHFCLDRKNAKYDGYSSLEPHQMQILCDSIKDATIASNGLFISDDESTYLKKTIQIPVASRSLSAGNLISASDVIFRRTNQSGLSFDHIMGLQKQRRVLSENLVEKKSFHQGDFRDANIAVIVACRMKSSRLPKKALLPIAGIPSVERCLSQCVAIPGVQRVILATSDLESDAVLRGYTLGGAVDFWQGDPDDVISRYLGACVNFGIDIVVRITADCPLVLPEVITYLLDQHFSTGADYTSAEDAAVGTSGEIINVCALGRIKEYFGVAAYSEYMTWYFRNNPEFFKINIVKLPSNLVRNYRMTLDYHEDLQMFSELYQKLGEDAEYYTAEHVFSILDNNPDIAKINAHLTLRYKTDQALIENLDRETKMICK